MIRTLNIRSLVVCVFVLFLLYMAAKDLGNVGKSVLNQGANIADCSASRVVAQQCK